MSKASRIPDAERTATMLDLLRRNYEGDGKGMSLAHVLIEEVAPATGGAARKADALVLSMWKSGGYKLSGFEIKASKADLKKELSDPMKAEALAKYCNTWTLVAWDEAVLVDGIPESWGIVITVDGAHGRELKWKRQPAKRTPEQWTRQFVCSMVRNAREQSLGAAFVARAVVEASENARRQGTSLAQQETREALAPLAEAIYGPTRWQLPAHACDPETLVAAAVERLTKPAMAVAS